MVGPMNKLFDEIGDRESHPLMGLLNTLTFFVRDCGECNFEIPEAEPRAVLRLLMDPPGPRQSDLAEIFCSESDVSEVLNGQREINVRRGNGGMAAGLVSPLRYSLS